MLQNLARNKRKTRCPPTPQKDFQPSLPYDRKECNMKGDQAVHIYFIYL